VATSTHALLCRLTLFNPPKHGTHALASLHQTVGNMRRHAELRRALQDDLLEQLGHLLEIGCIVARGLRMSEALHAAIGMDVWTFERRAKQSAFVTSSKVVSAPMSYAPTFPEGSKIVQRSPIL
jgi:hypothetical protein